MNIKQSYLCQIYILFYVNVYFMPLIQSVIGKLLDNALVIHDYSSFNIWINDEKVSTNVPANDGKWHHMAFTWKSSTGLWSVYKDGSKVKSSSSTFQKDKVLLRLINNHVVKVVNQDYFVLGFVL